MNRWKDNLTSQQIFKSHLWTFNQENNIETIYKVPMYIWTSKQSKNHNTFELYFFLQTTDFHLLNFD